jgi:hypothetical protein
VSAAYNHAVYLEPRKRMMQDWADFLERTQRGGKVLPFKGVRPDGLIPPQAASKWAVQIPHQDISLPIRCR